MFSVAHFGVAIGTRAEAWFMASRGKPAAAHQTFQTVEIEAQTPRKVNNQGYAKKQGLCKIH
jgi:hypothetical protein